MKFLAYDFQTGKLKSMKQLVEFIAKGLGKLNQVVSSLTDTKPFFDEVHLQRNKAQRLRKKAWNLI